MRAVLSIYLLLIISTGFSQSVNQHYYQVKSHDNLTQRKLTLAQQYADSALMVAVNTNDYDSLADAYQSLLDVHESKKDYQSSLRDSRLIIAYRDSATQAKQKNATTETKFVIDKEIESHAREVASLRDLIINLEEDRQRSQISVFIIIIALVVLSIIGVIILIRKNRQTLELIEQSETESQRLQYFKQTISHLLGSNLNDSLSSFENMNKSLANQVATMNKEDSMELLKRLHATAVDLKFKLSNVVQWVEYQADAKALNPINIESKELVQKVITSVATELAEKNITTDVFMPEGQIIFADRQMIETVLDNLISNAIRHTPDGGAITLFSGRKDGLITLGVKDSGHGMTEETVSQLFSVSISVRSDQKGKGLGLALSKELIERNGGRMYVESKVGEGSNFYFSLPEGKL